jgi:hypothetical protein
MRHGMRVCFYFSAFACSVMAQTVSFKSLMFPGIRATRATEASVQSFVTSTVGATPPAEIARLLPYSLVLENNTTNTVSAYTLRLTFVDANGKSGSRNRQYFNFEPVSNGMEILPGTARLVTPINSLDTKGASDTSPHSESGDATEVRNLLAAQLHSQVAVVVSLDLIVLNTGQVVGPDEGNTLSYLQGYLAGEHESASLVRTSLDAGESAQELSSRLTKLIGDLEDNKSFNTVARAGQVRRLLRLVGSSEEDLTKEADRILAKPSFTLYR